MGCQSLFGKKNDYKIGYLTQDPDFDDSKTVLDTVLQRPQRNPVDSWVWLIMLNYSEDKARLVWNGSWQRWILSSLGNWKPGQDGPQQAGYSGLSTPVGELSGGLRRRVQLAQFS